MQSIRHTIPFLTAMLIVAGVVLCGLPAVAQNELDAEKNSNAVAGKPQKPDAAQDKNQDKDKTKTEDGAGMRPLMGRPQFQRPVTQRPVTQRPVTQRPVTQRPVTQRPVTQRPQYQRPVQVQSRQPQIQPRKTQVQHPTPAQKQTQQQPKNKAGRITYQGAKPQKPVTLGPCDQTRAGAPRSNCPPQSGGRTAVGPGANPPKPNTQTRPPTVLGRPPAAMPPVIANRPPAVKPPIGRPPTVLPPTIVTLPPAIVPATDPTEPPVVVNVPPPVDPARPVRPPVIVVAPPADEPTYPPAVTPPTPATIYMGSGASGCVLRFMDGNLYYLRPDLHEIYAVPDLDVARVKCDFNGQAPSCQSGFPINDPDPTCRSDRYTYTPQIKPLQLDHCLHGTISMSRGQDCLPVAWVKTPMIRMNGRLYWVRLNTHTLHPVSDEIATRKGLLSIPNGITNCDSQAIGSCNSLRGWKTGERVETDTCLYGTMQMSREPKCEQPPS